MTFTVAQIWDFALKVLPIAAMIYTFIATRRKDVDEKIAQIDKKHDDRHLAEKERLDRVQGRVDRVEQTISTLPGREAIHNIELEMTRISGAMETMTAVMEGNQNIMSRLEKIVGRHEDHLLNEGKR